MLVDFFISVLCVLAIIAIRVGPGGKSTVANFFVSILAVIAVIFTITAAYTASQIATNLSSF